MRCWYGCASAASAERSVLAMSSGLPPLLSQQFVQRIRHTVLLVVDDEGYGHVVPHTQFKLARHHQARGP
jgi:hypothetical protein